MNKPFQAIFDGGVLKPIGPVPFGDHEVVTLIVAHGNGSASADEPVDDDLIDHDALAIAEREGQRAVSLEELHELLKSIPGSMSDVVIEDRGEY
ncbi:MAG TPA: DUF104 domain-containing protein [Pirellulales bacterium]|nr:DUF104 domain-containing protein [Pirellulales bacterium]